MSSGDSNYQGPSGAPSKQAKAAKLSIEPKAGPSSNKKRVPQTTRKPKITLYPAETEAAIIGLRVVRGIHFNYKRTKEGKPCKLEDPKVGAKTSTEGVVGTCTGVDSETGEIKVTWDSGHQGVYSASNEKYDLVVYDSAPSGKKTYRKCEGSNECKSDRSIYGMVYRCQVCPTVYLCVSCYMTGKHDASHKFTRHDESPDIKGVELSTRKSATSNRKKSRGIFKGTEVCRGPDWIKKDDSDRGEGNTGIVDEILWLNTDRSGATVKWNGVKDVSKRYAVGAEGFVRLKYTSFKKSKEGWPYYINHLPHVSWPANVLVENKTLEVGGKKSAKPNVEKLENGDGDKVPARKRVIAKPATANGCSDALPFEEPQKKIARRSTRSTTKKTNAGVVVKKNVVKVSKSRSQESVAQHSQVFYENCTFTAQNTFIAPHTGGKVIQNAGENPTVIAGSTNHVETSETNTVTTAHGNVTRVEASGSSASQISVGNNNVQEQNLNSFIQFAVLSKTGKPTFVKCGSDGLSKANTVNPKSKHKYKPRKFNPGPGLTLLLNWEFASDVDFGFKKEKKDLAKTLYDSLRRPGADKDTEKIRAKFQELTGIEVVIKMNIKTAQDLHDSLTNFKQQVLGMNPLPAYIVVVISTHGVFGHQLITDHLDAVNVYPHILYELSHEAPDFKRYTSDFPRLLFVQACQDNIARETYRRILNFNHKLEKLPHVATNFFIAFSTLPFHVSFREKDPGSYFIDCLVKTLKKGSDDGNTLYEQLLPMNEEIKQMMEDRNKRFGNQHPNEDKQVPVVHVSLDFPFTLFRF